MLLCQTKFWEKLRTDNQTDKELRLAEDLNRRTPDCSWNTNTICSRARAPAGGIEAPRWRDDDSVVLRMDDMSCVYLRASMRMAEFSGRRIGRTLA